MNSWFSTQIDRDFRNGFFGDGIRLHSNPNNPYDYQIITGVSYDEEKNILIVKYSSGEQITIDHEPYTDTFINTLQADWKVWDATYGKFDEDRTDYEPLCHQSILALAKELGVYSGDVCRTNMYVPK